MIVGLLNQLGSLFQQWVDTAETQAKTANRVPTPVPGQQDSFDEGTVALQGPEKSYLPPLWRNRNQMSKLQRGDRVHLSLESEGKEVKLSNCLIVGSSENDYASHFRSFGHYYLAVDSSGKFYEVGRDQIHYPSTEEQAWLFTPSLAQIMGLHALEPEKNWIPVWDTSDLNHYEERVSTPFNPGEKVYFPIRYLEKSSGRNDTEVYAPLIFPEKVYRDQSGDLYIKVKEELTDPTGHTYYLSRRVPLWELRNSSEAPRTQWNKLHQTT